VGEVGSPHQLGEGPEVTDGPGAPVYCPFA